MITVDNFSDSCEVSINLSLIKYDPHNLSFLTYISQKLKITIVIFCKYYYENIHFFLEKKKNT